MDTIGTKDPVRIVQENKIVKTAGVFYWIATIALLVFYGLPVLVILFYGTSPGTGMLAAMFIVATAILGGLPYVVSLIGNLILLIMSPKCSREGAFRINVLSGTVVTEFLVNAFMLSLASYLRIQPAVFFGVLPVVAILSIVVPQIILRKHRKKLY